MSRMWLKLSHFSITSLPQCVCTHPIGPMGIHFLCYAHGNECIGTHDVVRNTFVVIAQDVYRDISLGLMTKTRACKNLGREWSPWVTFHAPRSVGGCERMKPHTFWKLESRWTSKFLESNFKGQNSLDWRVPYIIGNLLEHRCLKWACTSHLSI